MESPVIAVIALLVIGALVKESRQRAQDRRFIEAAGRGDYAGVLKELNKSSRPSAVMRLLKARDHEAFVRSCAAGDSRTVRYLLDQSKAHGGERAMQVMLRARDFEGFRVASANGHTGVVTVLTDIAGAPG